MRKTLAPKDRAAGTPSTRIQEPGRPTLEAVATQRAISTRLPAATKKPFQFQIIARDLGELQPGISLDKVPTLLEVVEGPEHR